jgi:predicted pyridoxine 5'-phosphate oxidase superfamily flavin-nucleotide-binding protein
MLVDAIAPEHRAFAYSGAQDLLLTGTRNAHTSFPATILHYDSTLLQWRHRLKPFLTGSNFMYHEGSRGLQDRFGSRALADRLLEVTHRTRFSEDDTRFIERACFFFIATADAAGRPDCSFKGGPEGFVRVVAPDELVFPDYDGNGMFKSLGNLSVNPNVGLLFLRVGEKRGRLRVNGRAQLSFDDPAIADLPGAQALVRVTAEHIFPNCPRYIPKLELTEESIYVPKAGCEPVEPAWKEFESFRDVVPPRAR